MSEQRNNYSPSMSIKMGQKTKKIKLQNQDREDEWEDDGSLVLAGPPRDDVAMTFQYYLDTAGKNGILKFAKRYPSFYYTYGRSYLKSWHMLHWEIERPDVYVEWVYGRGPNKNEYAHQKYPNAYIKDHTKWWERYMYEKTCIIQELNEPNISINCLLRWIDKFRITIETKGSSMPLHVTRFLITSNFHPIGVYGGSGISYDELLRKIHIIVEK